MKFTNETTEKGLIIPPAALEIAGLPRCGRISYHVAPGLVVVLKRRMNGDELLGVVAALRKLHDDLFEKLEHLSGVPNKSEEEEMCELRGEIMCDLVLRGCDTELLEDIIHSEEIIYDE